MGDVIPFRATRRSILRQARQEAEKLEAMQGDHAQYLSWQMLQIPERRRLFEESFDEL